MLKPHFSPHGGAHAPCWHCSHFERMLYAGSAAWCSLPNAPRVQADPAHGCSAFQRESGADDEPGPPPVVEARAVLAPVKVEWAP